MRAVTMGFILGIAILLCAGASNQEGWKKIEIALGTLILNTGVGLRFSGPPQSIVESRGGSQFNFQPEALTNSGPK